MLSRRLILRFPPRPLLRTFATTPTHHSTSFKPSPSPPRLPKEDQEAYESLTKASLGAFSTSHNTSTTPETEAEILKLEAELGSQHKDLPKGGEKPLFEGEKNPVTGEVGGPKTDPLKYGDWSFNGRVTDF
ncbi:hypothetical protein H072_982 [Dactylellina haptotyla CBS 200.50]|uniref:Succinate dehydrogenase assembly factor 4, mitochondrial n=1 Tax=Dactylellina haptotyla (strain CBS 200.50) TaxID=1284197 RepID=S8CBE4_DACHA|nr:hypothetical protein H072_982 [Dactylellina haptotyla CBS 200.50]